MIGIQINNTFLDFSNQDYECPHCKKAFNDGDDKILKRIEKNKFQIYTKVKCVNCSDKFGVASNYKGDLVSFKLL